MQGQIINLERRMSEFENRVDCDELDRVIATVGEHQKVYKVWKKIQVGLMTIGAMTFLTLASNNKDLVHKVIEWFLTR